MQIHYISGYKKSNLFVVQVSAFWAVLVVWQGKAAVDRKSLIFEFQLPNSNPITTPILVNRVLQK
jgi:hypothetical protein